MLKKRTFGDLSPDLNTARMPRSRGHHRRSRSHTSPERRPRRRTHSHSPVRRHARSPNCRHARGRSPSRREARASRFTSTLTTCSTMPSYSSNYNHRGHRDVEESSVTRLIVDRGSSEDEDNRENRRRITERNEIYLEEVSEEDLKKEKTMSSKVCRAAKVVSGFLISMGLVLVFYVIISTIMGESTPLDIFDFEFGASDFVNHENDSLDFNYDIIQRDSPEFSVDILKIQSADMMTDPPEAGMGEILKQKYYEEAHSDFSYHTDADKNITESPENGTGPKDAEGRSYIAYIPVPLNNEEEEDGEEEEEERERDSNRRSDDSKPLFVPVMIMPGGGVNHHGGLLPNHMSHPNLGPSRPLPRVPHPLPPRGTPNLQFPRPLRRPTAPLPAMRNIPGIIPNVPSIPSLSNLPAISPSIPNLQLPQSNQNDFRNGLPAPLPPLSPLPAPLNRNLPMGTSYSTGHQVPQGGSQGNGLAFPGTGNMGSSFQMTGQNNGVPNNMNMFNGNMNNGNVNNGNFNSGNMNAGTFNNGNNNGYLGNSPNNGNNFNNFNNPNNGFTSNIPNNGHNGPNNGNNFNGNSFNGNNNNNNNFPFTENPVNRVNRVSSQSSGRPNTGHDNSREEILASLFDIMNRRSGKLPFDSSKSTGRANGELSSHMPKLDPPRPPLPPSHLRMRPRLLPKSRMSGPLPRPRPPLPRYRYRLPPILPPPGMPLIPRRPPPPRNIRKPPKDFQYPKDSTSIQDIIKFMKERKKLNSNPDPDIFDSNGDFSIGDQDHIIGPNPFGDTIEEFNPEIHENIGFGNDAQSGNNFNNYGGGGNQDNGQYISGGGGIPGFNNGGNNFNNGNSYNKGGSNFNQGTNNPNSNGNNFNDFNNGNSFNNGNNYNGGGNNFNNGGNSFNNGGNNFNNGNNFNGGGNNFNSGSNNFNNGGNSFNNGGGNNLPNTRSPSLGKSRPFNIMLDVYPMDVSSSSSGSRPFQTSISFGGDNSRFDSGDMPFIGGSGGISNNGENNYNNGYNSNTGNNNRFSGGYSNNNKNHNNNNNNRGDSIFSSSNNNGRFSSEDEANKHEIILHLNLFSKTPSSLRNNGRNSNGDFSGRSGAVSLEIPLTGQLSPLDVYRALMARVRSQKPQAQVQYRPGLEEKNPSTEKDEVEIELFDIEEGPRLLDAIEQGLRELNKDLPPDKRFVIDGDPVSLSDLYEAVNGNIMVPPSGEQDDRLSNHNHKVSHSHPNYSNTDEYYYYDYYDFEEEPTTKSSTTTGRPDHGPYEELPTPCWHHQSDSEEGHDHHH